MKTNIRIISIILSAILFAVIFFSSLFIILDSSHVCVGDDCPICREIHACVKTLTVVGTAAVSVVCIFVLRFKRIHLESIHSVYRTHCTLVSLKVKLSC